MFPSWLNYEIISKKKDLAWALLPIMKKNEAIYQVGIASWYIIPLVGCQFQKS